jgi:hypothetical protein
LYENIKKAKKENQLECENEFNSNISISKYLSEKKCVGTPQMESSEIDALRNENQELAIKLKNKNNEIEKLEADKSVIISKYEHEKNAVRDEYLNAFKENELLQSRINALLQTTIQKSPKSIVHIMWSMMPVYQKSISKPNQLYYSNLVHSMSNISNISATNKANAILNFGILNCANTKYISQSSCCALCLIDETEHDLSDEIEVFSKCENEYTDEQVQIEYEPVISMEIHNQIQSLNEEIASLKKQLDLKESEFSSVNSVKNYCSNISEVKKLINIVDYEVQTAQRFSISSNQPISICPQSNINASANFLNIKAANNAVYSLSSYVLKPFPIDISNNTFINITNGDTSKMVIKLINISTLAQSEIGSLLLYLKRPCEGDLLNIIEATLNKITLIKDELHEYANHDIDYNTDISNHTEKLTESLVHKFTEVDQYMSSYKQACENKIIEISNELSESRELARLLEQKSIEKDKECDYLQNKLNDENECLENTKKGHAILQESHKQLDMQLQNELQISQTNKEKIAKKDTVINGLIRKLNMVDLNRCEAEKKNALLHEKIVSLEINYDHKVKENCQLADRIKAQSLL